MTTKVDKAYIHIKAGMSYGDVRELLDLSSSQVFAINYAIRQGIPAWKVSRVLSKITDDMKSTEIERIIDESQS